MTDRSLLDPEDWDGYRRRAHTLLDQLVDRLEHADQGPVWRPIPKDAKARLAVPFENAPQGLDRVLSDLEELVLPYGTGNTHPRFLGWVHGTGSAGGVLAEMVAATLNPNCGGREHGAIYVERAVIDGVRRWFGFPDSAGGILVTGTSMANLLGLAVARHHGAGCDLRLEGVDGLKLVGYTTTEAHSSLTKAFELLGLGRRALRRLPADESWHMDPAALSAAVAADRAAGFRPFCVIANAGTVNTGAIDDLTAIAAVCRREGLWLHVDGAFGALGILAPGIAPRLAGIEQADSIALDFHKWLHVPYDAGCLLVRDRSLQEATFSGRPPYLATGSALAGGDPWPCDLGFELSRGFRALKVWFTLKEHGLERLGQAIARNCAQAQVLAARLAARPNIAVMAPVELQIVCCRYQPPGLDELVIDALNARLVAELQLRGIAAPSTCQLHGRLCIRLSLTNHRFRDQDIDIVVQSLDEIGHELEQVATTAEPGLF